MQKESEKEIVPEAEPAQNTEQLTGVIEDKERNVHMLQHDVLRIGERNCSVYSYGTGPLLIQMADSNELPGMEREAQMIYEQSGHLSFSLLAVPVLDWNEELTPWENPPVYGDRPFGEGADRTLFLLLDEIIPVLREKNYAREEIFLGGYSLAGLFSLYAGYNTEADEILGVAGVSPSVWYPGWKEYIETHRIHSTYVYLSLGDREGRTRNPVMSTIDEMIKTQAQHVQEENRHCVLEWNKGNHFQNPDGRMAKGFAWLLTELHHRTE